MKVFVFTPTWVQRDGELAMRPETRASIEGQVLPAGVELRWEIGLLNPYPGEDYRNVLAQYERARDLFLASDCEALLTFEHDMAMPADAVEKLLAVDADVVYAVYVLRHGSLVLNAFEYIGGRNPGESLSLHPERLPKAGEVIRVSGAGFGCTLIRRGVLERLPFHQGDGTGAPDMPFAVDCLRANITSMAHFGVLCDHYEGATRLRPFGGGLMNWVRVLALQSVNVATAAGLLRLEAGEPRDVPPDALDEMVRAGYVTVAPTVGSDEGIETAAVEGAPERAVVAVGKKKKLRLGD